MADLEDAASVLPEKRRALTWTRFDAIMLGVMALLVASIAAVIVRGDQIGLMVQATSPASAASSRASIQVTFDNPIAAPLNDSALTIAPPTAGQMIVSGNQITFKPAQPLSHNTQYTVTLHAGIQAITGQQLKQDVQWTFRVSPPRILYLGPTDNMAQNLYLIDPAQTSQDRPLTFSQTGLQSYDIAPDGSFAVYSELQADYTDSLFVLDLTTFAIRQLYACPDSFCNHPAISPDGKTVAFEKTNLNSGLNVGIGQPRVFLLDIASQKVTPLFADNQILSYSPQWSPDGKLLMVFDSSSGGIDMRDMATRKDTPVQALEGDVGLFSPDGRWFLYPTTARKSEAQLVTHMALVDMTSPTLAQHSLEADNDANDDQSPVWASDSKHVYFLRTTPDQPVQGLPQVAMMDITTGQVTTLLQETDYRDNAIIPSPSGDSLLLQRYRENNSNPDARSEFWLYDLATSHMRQIGANGLYAKWIP